MIGKAYVFLVGGSTYAMVSEKQALENAVYYFFSSAYAFLAAFVPLEERAASPLWEVHHLPLRRAENRGT